MNENIGLQILRLKRRISELELRLINSHCWTNGEITTFQTQIKEASRKLKQLNHYDHKN